MIRIKAFKTLFGRIVANQDSLSSAENELMQSCQKTLDLYAFVLSLPIALQKAANLKIETGLKKFQPTAEEANPNYKFAHNRFIEMLSNDLPFMKFLDQKGLSWSGHESFVKKLYAAIQTREYFTAYMENGVSSMEDDLAVVKSIFEQELEDNEELADIMEEISLFWIDDLGYVLSMLVKDIKKFARNGFVSLPPLFQNEDDMMFAKRLLTQSLLKYDEYSSMMKEYIPNWDMERLVMTDLLLVVMGIAEAVTFETIPLKVTINEYVDISKYYSTPNSRVFVNGLLDRMLQKLSKEGVIVKSGRGLVGSL